MPEGNSNVITVDRPVTLYIKFPAGVFPRYVEFRNNRGDIEYFRVLYGKLNRIKLNLVKGGTYFSNQPFEIVKMTSIEIPKQFPKLPPAERNRWKPLKFVDNPALKGTPARIFTETGVVEHGPDYYKYPKCVREFIDLHEQGHLFYKTEEYCDLWALVNYLRLGYNRSTAYWTLCNVLKKTPANVQRIEQLVFNIKKTQNESKPA